MSALSVYSFYEPCGKRRVLLLNLLVNNQIRLKRFASVEKRHTGMLKITRVSEPNQKITLQLDGSVAGPWIELLRASSESVLAEGLQLTIDLENICFIDCEGLALINSLLGQGVQQVNAPLFVAEQLRKCEAAEGD